MMLFRNKRVAATTHMPAEAAIGGNKAFKPRHHCFNIQETLLLPLYFLSFQFYEASSLTIISWDFNIFNSKCSTAAAI